MNGTSGRINVFEGYRETIEDDHKVMRAYNAALQSYNAGHWDGTVSMCGKVLESIAKSELPFTEHGGSLGKLIEKLSKQIYNERPLDKFAASLKDRHGLGGHFELDKEANQEAAMLTLDLIECMMSYLYVMRVRIDQLLELVGSDAVPVEEENDYDDYLQEAQRREERERLAKQAMVDAQRAQAASVAPVTPPAAAPETPAAPAEPASAPEPEPEPEQASTPTSAPASSSSGLSAVIPPGSGQAESAEPPKEGPASASSGDDSGPEEPNSEEDKPTT